MRNVVAESTEKGEGVAAKRGPRYGARSKPFSVARLFFWL
jgi:hypothetical protein